VARCTGSNQHLEITTNRRIQLLPFCHIWPCWVIIVCVESVLFPVPCPRTGVMLLLGTGAVLQASCNATLRSWVKAGLMRW
jgi:hypothetical protein